MNGFYGSAFGNILGTLYFLLFQCVGFLYIKRIFPKKGLLFHLLTGSVSALFCCSGFLLCLPSSSVFP